MQPYRDEYRDLIFMKGRQVEMSEFSMNWLLHKLDMHPYTTGLHAFPRAGQAQKFTKQRLATAIKDSQYISKWYDDRNSEQMMRKFVKEKDSHGLEPYNFYILGATWESHTDTVGDAARSISLDFIIYDERQDHPNDVETVLGEGASHSEFKQTLTLGTPKLPGIQFDQEWNVSNKMFWVVKCPHCGREEPITMDNIMDSGDDAVGYIYACPNCKQPLDRNNGRWIETNPIKRPQYHGYHINQLMVSWLTADEIMRKKMSPTFPRRRFYNEVLGESYGGDDIPITIAMLEECANNDYHLGQTENEDLYAGIDWGSKSWCYLQNRDHRLIDCLIVGDSDPREHPKKIAAFLAKYGAKHIRKVVCDAGPDITRFYNLREELKNRNINNVFACYYSTPPAKTDVQWDEKEGTVTVGRSEAIEKIIDEISDCRMILPGADKNVERVDTLFDHFTNIAAEKTQNKSGNQFIIYVNTGPDHFLHAKVYANVAMDGASGRVLSGSTPPIINPREPCHQKKTYFPTFTMSRRRRRR